MSPERNNSIHTQVNRRWEPKRLCHRIVSPLDKETDDLGYERSLNLLDGILKKIDDYFDSTSHRSLRKFMSKIVELFLGTALEPLV